MLDCGLDQGAGAMTTDHLLEDILAGRPRARDARPGDRPTQIEPKHDGHRVIVVRDARGIRAYGRKMRDDMWRGLLASPSIAPMIERIPPMTVVEGEVHSPNHRATAVRTLLNDRSPALRFSPFALPMLCGEDWREAELPRVYAELHRTLGTPHESSFISQTLLPLQQYTLDQWLTMARSEGLEGYMLKSEHWPQGSDGWLKLKHTSTVDCEVYGWIPGTGKHAGRMGALMVGLHDGPKFVGVGKVGTGFSDEERAEPRVSWLGATVEVEYQSVQANGRLQFPRFVRRREDKLGPECSVEQIR